MDPGEQRFRFDGQGYAGLLGVEFDHAAEGHTRLRMEVMEHISDPPRRFTAAFSPPPSLKLNIRARRRLVIRHRPGGGFAVGDTEAKNASSGRLVVKGLPTFTTLRDSS